MKKILVALLLVIGAVLFVGGFMAVRHFDEAIDEYQYSAFGVEAFFDFYEPQPFFNEATFVTRLPTGDDRDVKYLFEAPEGFDIISYSYAWDYEMLRFLHQELLNNTHGREIQVLSEIVIYPEGSDDMILGTFSPAISVMDFALSFPALPDDFSVAVTRNVGRIVLYGGDTNTTIESMASVLSHEYGHLFTFYHMFGFVFDDLAGTEYAILRDASRHGLITTGIDDMEFYLLNHNRFLIEVAAEDYVQLMGSPTARQVGNFVDVRQMLEQGLENPPNAAMFRNAFPQLNMRMPLASEVHGLREFFFSFVDEEPVTPVEERMEINLDIRPVTVNHDLVTGRTAFTHYIITWNTPYHEAIYTLVTYNPEDEHDWARPIRTVFPGQQPEAVVGLVTQERGNYIHSMDDEVARGNRVFLVVALLPDGTSYLSERLHVQF